MSRRGAVRRGFGRATACIGLFIALVAAAPPAGAQRTAGSRDDTGQMLAALAAVLWANTGPWFVAPQDTLTARLAALAGVTITPAPAGMACAFDAPTGKTGGLVTTLVLYGGGRDTVYATISHRCHRNRWSPVGPVFVQAESYRVVRTGLGWTAARVGRSIT